MGLLLFLTGPSQVCVCIHERAHACLSGVHLIVYNVLLHCFSYMQMFFLFYLIAIRHAPGLHLMVVRACAYACAHVINDIKKYHRYLRWTHMRSHAQTLHLFMRFKVAACYPYCTSLVCVCLSLHIGAAHTVYIYSPSLESYAHMLNLILIT
jgi:hypothetical protein